MHCLARIVRRPLDDYLRALHAALGTVRASAIAVIAGAFLLSWWLYVPIHELLHAAGCVLAGGTVTRLEVDPLYGAALLQRVFPFVTVGSEYAGQLTGFDTQGSDVVYLLTDFLPFTLTILIGVPLLHWAATDVDRPLRACVKLGAALPLAYAPFMSVTGDYYEMGSIVVSRGVAWWQPALPLARWRSDDLFRLIGRLSGESGGLSWGDIGGVCAALLVGLVLAFATYAVGAVWAGVIVRPAKRQRGRGAAEPAAT